MTRENLRTSKRLLVEMFTGSRKYKLDDDNSDVDVVGVFEKDTILGDLNNDYFIENDNRYYSLELFCKLLYEGDLTASEIIEAEYQDFKFLSGPFQSHFLKQSLDIINKKAISNWIRSSQTLFNKAIRLGELKLNKPNVIDFCKFAYWGIQDFIKEIPLKTVIDTSKYNSNSTYPSDNDAFLNRMGLEKTGIDQMYKLYHAYTDNKLPGLLDSNGQLIENSVDGTAKSTLTLKGLLFYDKKTYLKYLRFHNNLKNAKVINGYSTKYMMHAFRYLYVALHALSTNKFLIVLPEAPFLKRIKKGEESLVDLIPKYKELIDSAEKLLEKCDYTHSLHPATLRSIMFKCKYQIENINEYVV